MKQSDIVFAIIEPDLIPQEVVARAAWLAKLTGSGLTLSLCDADVTALARHFYVSNEAREIAAGIRQAQAEIIDELAEPARKAGIPVQTEILEERPVADAVLQRVLEINPRYVVKGTQYHSDARRAVFVDTDWHLLRTCPYPLWLVKPRELAERPVIVAAVDPTHADDAHARLDTLLVEEASRLADSSGGELHLLHTWQPLSGVGAEATKTFKPIRLSTRELNDRSEREHREKLDALANAQGVSAEHTHQLPGAARDVIPWFARERQADLVVMGAVARWSFKRTVIGSTAEKVLDHLPCDILILRAG